MDVAQTASFIQAMTYEAGLLDYEEFPVTSEPVWILGSKYHAVQDLDAIKHDFQSKLWFTYRRGYAPIGGTGPNGDTGWGCMLRCGQMMLAQALVNRHLGRAWRWIAGKYDPKYFEILRLFLDKKGSNYSIHQIASMGVSESKSVGEWFGPNTIAQVLKKLAVYDEWSSLVLHVALDNTVVIDDLEKMCISSELEPSTLPIKPKNTCTHSQKEGTRKLQPQTGSSVHSTNTAIPSIHLKKRTALNPQINCDTERAGTLNTNGIDHKSPNISDCDRSANEKCNCGPSQISQNQWRPLLLIIPLRLGLTDINPVYMAALKKCLMFPQSVGIIGGKPHHAHWFIGFVEDQLLYLDPHTTHNYTDVTQPDQTDDTYHCDYICRMKVSQLDPSIALGFYCGSLSEFNDLCQNIKKNIIGERTPMFELHQHRPPHWPPFEPYSPQGAAGTDFTVVEECDRQFDTDEEFELL